MAFSGHEDITQSIIRDLGSFRRDRITSYDPTRDPTQRRDRAVTERQLEARRAVNQQGTDAAEKAANEQNAKSLSAWNSLPKEWDKETKLEDLPDIMRGQAHRARLNRELRMKEDDDDQGFASSTSRQGLPGISTASVNERASGDVRNYIPPPRSTVIGHVTHVGLPTPNSGRNRPDSSTRPSAGEAGYRPLDIAVDHDREYTYSGKSGGKKVGKVKFDSKLTSNRSTTQLQKPTRDRPPSSTFNKALLADTSTFLTAANIRSPNPSDIQKFVSTGPKAAPGSKAARFAATKKEAVISTPDLSKLTLDTHKVALSPRALEQSSTTSDKKTKQRDEGTDGLSSPKSLNSKIWSGSESQGSQQASQTPKSGSSKSAMSTTKSDLSPKEVDHVAAEQATEEAAEGQKSMNPVIELEGSVNSAFSVPEPMASVFNSLVDVEQPTSLSTNVEGQSTHAAADLMDRDDENVSIASQPALKPASPQVEVPLEQGHRILYRGRWYVPEDSQEPKPARPPTPASPEGRVRVSGNVSIPRSWIGDDELVRGCLGPGSREEGRSLSSSKWNPKPSHGEERASVPSAVNTLDCKSDDSRTVLQKARLPPQGPEAAEISFSQPKLPESIPMLQPNVDGKRQVSPVSELSSQMEALRVTKQTKRAPESSHGENGSRAAEGAGLPAASEAQKGVFDLDQPQAAHPAATQQQLDKPHSQSVQTSEMKSAMPHEAAVMRVSMGLSSQYQDAGLRPSTPRGPLVLQDRAGNVTKPFPGRINMPFESSPVGYGTQGHLRSQSRRKAHDYQLDSKSVSTVTAVSSTTNAFNTNISIGNNPETTVVDTPAAAPPQPAIPSLQDRNLALTGHKKPVVVESRWAPAPAAFEDSSMTKSAQPLADKTNKKTSEGVGASKWASPAAERASDTIEPLSVSSTRQLLSGTKPTPQKPALQTHGPPAVSTSTAAKPISNAWPASKSSFGAGSLSESRWAKSSAPRPGPNYRQLDGDVYMLDSPDNSGGEYVAIESAYSSPGRRGYERGRGGRGKRLERVVKSDDEDD